jgi:pimeloyl-ACP methyl ester carboxylesterase
MNNALSKRTAGQTSDEGIQRIQHHRLFYRRLTPSRGGSPEQPNLVFLHEGLGCTAMWHDFPARVVEDTGLCGISYDRSGYGRSHGTSPPRGKNYLQIEAREILPRFLESQKIEKAVLVGHSDGGSIALLAAAACPEKISGIVTEAAHVFVENLTLEGIRDTVAAYETRDLEKRLGRYHGAKVRDLFFAWADTWLSPSFRDWNIEGCLDKIQCPSLVIQGLEDPYGTVLQVQSIVAGIGAQATPLLIPECGHAPHRDAPAQVCRAIVEFVNTLR